MHKIKPPPVEKTVWAVPSNAQLSIAIIEPREHVALRSVLSNFAHVYGGSDVALYIFHGSLNLAYIKSVTAKWQNVVYVDLKVPKLKYPSMSFTN